VPYFGIDLGVSMKRAVRFIRVVLFVLVAIDFSVVHAADIVILSRVESFAPTLALKAESIRATGSRSSSAIILKYGLSLGS
jgi:hypothetical protein